MALQNTPSKLFELLESKCQQYQNPGFIESDPISIPHLFTLKEDIEIAGFLSATIAWGQRKAIVKNGKHLMELMEFAPYDFIMNAGEKDLKKLEKFVHRTFNATDCLFFIESLRNIYKKYGGLQSVFEAGYRKEQLIKSSIAGFRDVFFEIPHLQRTRKHISNVEANAAAKRINMYLRWMVRPSKGKVDFGLWNGIHASALFIPLDLHSGNIARKLGLLQRKQDDWKAVEELTCVLRQFDPCDPVKYDFALFGMGVFESKL